MKSSAHDEKFMDVSSSKASTPKKSKDKRNNNEHNNEHNNNNNNNANEETNRNETQQTLTIQTLRQLHLYWHNSLKSDSKHDIIAKLFHPVDNRSVSIQSAHLVDPNIIHSSKLLLSSDVLHFLKV
ncbi:hypothetical protein RFI_24574 [Reticulomyxa filosa]|uniref:Uncharacterized protein n=1 Tax=Reticulomyxa filosa TaxID=46433 RepID=X6MGM3_RETFI|nr:hypothetical protein RFI_24574 [Reticulomyxa filosa]|eukprot:ETO12801.1 hypothetical protein RFI_24574 [Reticulomyxa filosa]